MVCIAAFIILCILSIFVAILSIFRRDLGKKYWAVFKKAWGCVGKKISLQKCETGFKDDIKNSILKKVIIKKPKLVKPISIGIEITAVLIVAVAIWSLIEGAKAGLSLWTLGTCNVTHPSACALGAEICSIDQEEPQNLLEFTGRWFSDWGEIFSAVPDKFRSWDTANFPLHGITLSQAADQTDTTPTAIDILDPGCIVCLQSFKNQQSTGFFDAKRTLIVPYAIENPDGTYKFKNSGIIVRYLLATTQHHPSAAYKILEKIFTQYNENKVIYQTVFNDLLTETAAETLIKTWLAELKFPETDIAAISTLAHAESTTQQIAENKNIVENQIHVKGIPTLIYDNSKHTGLFKAE